MTTTDQTRRERAAREHARADAQLERDSLDANRLYRLAAGRIRRCEQQTEADAEQLRTLDAAIKATNPTTCPIATLVDTLPL